MQKAITYLLFFIIVSPLCVSQPASANNYFHFTRPKLGLELSYEYNREIRKGNDINSKDITNDFSEQFKIETDGWVYHPALIDFTLGLEPTWTQTREDHSTTITSNSNDTDTDLLGYYFDASVFQYKPYTFHFFARQQDNDVTSSFSRRTNTRTRTYGSDLFLKQRTFPTTIGYVHNESQQSGFYSSSDNWDEIKLNMSLPKKNNKTELDVSLVDKTQSTNNSVTDIETLNSALKNRWDFSGDKRRYLFSSLLYRQTQGSYSNNSGTTFNQNLSWEHTKALDSNYQVLYNKNESGDFNSETMSFGAGLSYDIFDNLRTNFTCGASYSESQGGKEQIYRGGIGFDYDKDTPIGIFRLNSYHSYKQRDRKVSEDNIKAINEPHTLNDTDHVYLNQKNVNGSTVVVTDVTGTILYFENQDYTLTELTPYLRISRKPLGRIADGDTVLVSYWYENPADFDDAVFGQSYGFTYMPFQFLSFLYRYHQSEQIYRGGAAPDILENSIVHTGEATLDLNWSRTKLSYQDSFKNYGSSHTRWVAEETVSYIPSRNFFTLLSASYGETKFEEASENEIFYLLKSQIDYSPSRWWKVSIATFRNDISGESVNTLDHGVSVDFNMYYGIWNASVEYLYINEEDRAVDETRELSSIIFTITRRLW